MINLDSLEGWLLKRKSTESYLFSTNKRWFKVKEVEGADTSELALCYFNSPKDTTDAKGWIYLKDVTDISDDEKCFKITSVSRTMVLEAQTKSEHRLWLQGIVELCPKANIENVVSNIPAKVVTSKIKRSHEEKIDLINDISVMSQLNQMKSNNARRGEGKEIDRDDRILPDHLAVNESACSSRRQSTLKDEDIVRVSGENPTFNLTETSSVKNDNTISIVPVKKDYLENRVKSRSNSREDFRTQNFHTIGAGKGIGDRLNDHLRRQDDNHMETSSDINADISRDSSSISSSSSSSTTTSYTASTYSMPPRRQQSSYEGKYDDYDQSDMSSNTLLSNNLSNSSFQTNNNSASTNNLKNQMLRNRSSSNNKDISGPSKMTSNRRRLGSKDIQEDDDDNIEDIDINKPLKKQVSKRQNSFDNESDTSDNDNSKNISKNRFIQKESDESDRNVHQIEDPVYANKSTVSRQPTTAPPRKAIDALRETSSSGTVRQSVDDLINKSRNKKTLDLSDEEGEGKHNDHPARDRYTSDDIRDERNRRMQPTTQQDYESEKPAKINYNQKNQNSKNIIPDNNFLSENWDEESFDDDLTLPVHITDRTNRNSEIVNGPGVKPITKNVRTPGVQADKNWLEENFDDD